MTNSSPNPMFDASPLVRVRFPPSPTGMLHVGGGRTALFNYLFAYGQARREGRQGEFVLRIEDTDRARLLPGATEGILDILAWFGLSWDEGPDKGGPYGPYVQSERIDLYQHYADELLATDHAYPCFCTPERLQGVREAQQASGLPPGYDRHCRALPPAERAAKLAEGAAHVVRFTMPRDGETRVLDLLRGEVTFQNATLEDLVLLKSDGYPTYHLANVVDDHLMRVTHIMRGEEWIPSAPLHIRLYAAFGWEAPKLAHMPLILAPGGGKLSKRHGATAMDEFRSQGYLPEAVMNYLALLGWSLDGVTEIFSKEELLAAFTLERVSPSPATFDYAKLAWFNQHYINHVVPLDDLAARIVPFLARAGLVDAAASDPAGPEFAHVRAVTELLKDRLKTLAEAPGLMRYFLREELDPYDAAQLVPKKTEPAQALAALSAVRAALPELDLDDETATDGRLRAMAEELGLKPGQLFMAIRVAVTGRTESPGLFGTLRVIGMERVSRRIDAAVARLA
ncbi:MAG: glutamate--tRNA ligase [Thermomicrobiales bacterium]